MQNATTPWTSFTRRIAVRASIADIYTAWTTQKGLESWFLRLAQFTNADGQQRAMEEPVQAGDRYHWLWHGWSDDHPEKREVLAANGVDFFQFGFTGDCVVSAKIFPEKDVSVVELVQSEIPPSDDPKQNLHFLCSNGWTFYLANLKSILEGGIDLRNRDVALGEVLNA